MTINGFGHEYNVSRSTIYRLQERGAIKFVHIGRAVRIRREDAERWYQSLLDDQAND